MKSADDNMQSYKEIQEDICISDTYYIFHRKNVYEVIWRSGITGLEFFPPGWIVSDTLLFPPTNPLLKVGKLEVLIVTGKTPKQWLFLGIERRREENRTEDLTIDQWRELLCKEVI